MGPFDALADIEAALRRVYYGLTGSGLFWDLRRPPPAAVRAMQRGAAAAAAQTSWWITAFARARDLSVQALRRVAIRSRSALLREIAAAVAERPARAIAERIASGVAAEIVAGAEASTRDGLDLILRDAQRRRLAGAALRREISAWVGPSPGQLNGSPRRAGIRQLERRWRRDGVPDNEILRRVRQRTLRAARTRAEIIADGAIVRTANESRAQVFAEAGITVYSENAGDDRVRRLHRLQTEATRASPSLPGEPWAIAAPFQGLPPYEIRCRCWVAAAGPAAPAGQTPPASRLILS